MRAFLAFDVSHEVAERMELVETELKSTGADLGLVSRENLHFTVKFLGEIPEGDIRKVDERVGKLELSAFDVTVKGIGVFPDLRRPRVVWAGVDAADVEPISQRADAVIGALDGVGKPEGREFQPHITIARVRSPRNLERLASFVQENASREFGRTRIAGLKFKSSVLTPKGPVYRDLREYGFR
jgi:2'-5' RNA ligase